MNLSKPLSWLSQAIYSMSMRARSFLPRQRSLTFGRATDALRSEIGPIFVINLDRQASRWADMVRELGAISDTRGVPLSGRVVRYSACDAQADPPELLDGTTVQSFYTLADQLFVEPQPNALPDEFDLECPIKMSKAEIAVACSHIGIWKRIAQCGAPYSLVLEDDVRFERGFGRILDHAWREMEDADRSCPQFDILYVSYKEVRNGAPKELVSANVFRPERGLWYLSGYVLSKKGAQALLDLLPCRGPIDLWINHQFRELDVRALRRSVINQRRDLHSTNCYSILPALSRIGVLDEGSGALFQGRPTHSPVFAFGAPGSGLSSLAMALSMLGYRCCNDFDSLPESEFDRLIRGKRDRVFDAYVNIGSLEAQVPALMACYPRAKFIVMDDLDDACDHVDLSALKSADLLILRRDGNSQWRPICEHLRLAPPNAPYPLIKDIGLRTRQSVPPEAKLIAATRRLRHDPSPWIAKPLPGWSGISADALEAKESFGILVNYFEDEFTRLCSARWLLRNDTFPGNLGLFRPANVKLIPGAGLAFAVIEQELGVRKLSAAAISTRAKFLFGRFEATLQATNVPGLVTGFFLHRDSPRQEIDVEIPGNRPDHLLVNVFYNPGANDAKFDYGYRGTPVMLKLGFDASKSIHQYVIEWDPGEIRWFVDRKLVHRRAIWDPTPIPHLPMSLHVNTWPTASSQLAGRLARKALPASAILRRVAVETYNLDGSTQPGGGHLGQLVKAEQGSAMKSSRMPD